NRTYRARVSAQKGRRLLNHLVEDGCRIELGRKHAARARKLLRQRPRGPLRLEQLAACQCAPRRISEVVRELEILVSEQTLLGEEDHHETRALRPRTSRRHR